MSDDKNNQSPKPLLRSEYYEYRKQLKAGTCMLCEGKQIVLHEGILWTWVAAIAPYWKYHTMLITKRHITQIKELTPLEWHEFIKLQEKIVELYKDSSIRYKDETPLDNVLVFWRHRYQLFNPKLKADNIDHLHIHFASDREHFLDPISDEQASDWDINEFAGKL